MPSPLPLGGSAPKSFFALNPSLTSSIRSAEALSASAIWWSVTFHAFLLDSPSFTAVAPLPSCRKNSFRFGRVRTPQFLTPTPLNFVFSLVVTFCPFSPLFWSSNVSSQDSASFFFAFSVVVLLQLNNPPCNT